MSVRYKETVIEKEKSTEQLNVLERTQKIIHPAL